MNKVLVAVTYHNQTRHTLHKTLRSTYFRNPMPSNWRCDTVVFSHDDVPSGEFIYQRTQEETLGGKRNAAVRYARANNYQLIAFLDDDDLFGPSWIPALCAQAETDFADKILNRIYHPQWNVLFDPRAYVVREHFGQNDPRFDSRDMVFYNPWSALCAFDPMSAKWSYRKHKKSDPKYSFEDWSFNLDTWCDGQEHVVVPDTYHFLRMRANSLGKSTIFNTLEHSRFFTSPELIQRKIATRGLDEPGDIIDDKKLLKEMQAMADIEPQLYFYRVSPINQQCNNRAGKTVDALCEVVKRMPFAQDVFWMHDHLRVGGAEKALKWVGEFLRGFKDGADQVPHQVWIDDVSVTVSNNEAMAQWGHGITHLLRIWAQGGTGRSLHICNTGAGWNALVNNPALFDGVEVYLYLFNDDLMFPSGSMTMDKAGYHSPIYNCADVLDRPNIHIITDSDHHSTRLAELTGLGNKIKKIAVPAGSMPNKGRAVPTAVTEILWAGRFDYFKGIEELIECVHKNNPNYRITVYGDGQGEWANKLALAEADGCNLNFNGAYKNFADIPGEYDFFLFTSEREGMPNVVQEALASGLPVLARKAAWTNETSVTTYDGDLDETIMGMKEFVIVKRSREDCELLAISAYKECLS